MMVVILMLLYALTLGDLIKCVFDYSCFILCTYIYDNK